MMISYVIILDDMMEVVFKTKIRHKDKRDMRWKLSEKVKRDRRLRLLMDLYDIVLIVAGNKMPFEPDEALKKKF